jgi:lysozyme family protein
MDLEWKAERERQNKRGWWHEVASRIDSFPQDPHVHHIHPFGWIDNFALKGLGNYDDLFESVISIVLRHEGGFVDDPDDKGGATNKGISWPTWSKYALPDLGKSPTLENLKALTIEEAKKIYRKRFWEPRGMDQVSNARLALMIFDWSVNSGRADEKMQEMLCEKFGASIYVDGAIGPMTIAALNACEDLDALIREIGVTRRNYYHYLVSKEPVKEKWLKGWLKRVKDCEEATL